MIVIIRSRVRCNTCEVSDSCVCMTQYTAECVIVEGAHFFDVYLALFLAFSGLSFSLSHTNTLNIIGIQLNHTQRDAWLNYETNTQFQRTAHLPRYYQHIMIQLGIISILFDRARTSFFFVVSMCNLHLKTDIFIAH